MSRTAFAYWIALVFLVGLAQYAPTAFDAIARGDVQVWNLDSSTIDDAGPMKYVKDLFVFGFGVYWPLAINRNRYPRRFIGVIRVYGIWMSTIVSIGLLSFAFQWSPLLFLVAGVRWIMLLHASFGLFMFARDMPKRPRTHRGLAVFLSILGLVDLYVVSKQLSIGSAVLGVSFAQNRMTGLFSNAAIAGLFGLSLAMMSTALDRAGAVFRLALCMIGMVVAVSSGTRFAILAVAMILAIVIWEIIEAKFRRSMRMLIYVIAVPVLIIGVVGGYVAMINAIGRGDLVGAQLEEGGRIYNLVAAIDQLGQAGLGELAIGRGLGVGTNTAVSYLWGKGIDPSQFRFNILIDNAFITLIFQIGIVGLLIFCVGLSMFMWEIVPRNSPVLFKRYVCLVFVFLAACFNNNVFEQFFFVTVVSMSLGDLFWRAEIRRIGQGARKIEGSVFA